MAGSSQAVELPRRAKIAVVHRVREQVGVGIEPTVVHPFVAHDLAPQDCRLGQSSSGSPVAVNARLVGESGSVDN